MAVVDRKHGLAMLILGIFTRGEGQLKRWKASGLILREGDQIQAELPVTCLRAHGVSAKSGGIEVGEQVDPRPEPDRMHLRVGKTVGGWDCTTRGSNAPCTSEKPAKPF